MCNRPVINKLNISYVSSVSNPVILTWPYHWALCQNTSPCDKLTNASRALRKHASLSDFFFILPFNLYVIPHYPSSIYIKSEVSSWWPRISVGPWICFVGYFIGPIIGNEAHFILTQQHKQLSTYCVVPSLLHILTLTAQVLEFVNPLLILQDLSS